MGNRSTLCNKQYAVNKYVGTAYDTVKKVSDNLEDISTVADALGEDFPEGGFQDIANNIDNILTVNENMDDVNTVAENILEVVETADNIDAIIDAPNQAELARKWAQEAEDVEVLPGEYSAYHYANKAEEQADRAETEVDTLSNAIRGEGYFSPAGGVYPAPPTLGLPYSWFASDSGSVGITAWKEGELLQYVPNEVDPDNVLGDYFRVGGINSGASAPINQPRQYGDGVTTTFAVPDPDGVQYPSEVFHVFFDGLRQLASTDYNITSAGVIEFKEAPPLLVAIDITLFAPNYLADDVSSGLVTATGSTTSRILSDRFADVVNVKDFGAVGDGVTDDTAAIQAAIAYAVTLTSPIDVYNGANYNGVEVKADEGVYLISSTLEMPNKCNGIKFTMKLLASNTFTEKEPMLKIDHIDDLAFHYLDFDLHLDGNERAAGFLINNYNRCSAKMRVIGCKGFGARIGRDDLDYGGHEFIMESFEYGFREWFDPDRPNNVDADGYALEVLTNDGHYNNIVVFNGDKGVRCRRELNTFNVGHIWGLNDQSRGFVVDQTSPVSLNQFYFDGVSLRIKAPWHFQAENCFFFVSESRAPTLDGFVVLESTSVNQVIANLTISGKIKNNSPTESIPFFAFDETTGNFSRGQTDNIRLDLTAQSTGSGAVTGYADTETISRFGSGVTRIDFTYSDALATNLQSGDTRLVSVAPRTGRAVGWYADQGPGTAAFISDTTFTGSVSVTGSINQNLGLDG